MYLAFFPVAHVTEGEKMSGPGKESVDEEWEKEEKEAAWRTDRDGLVPGPGEREQKTRKFTVLCYGQ